MTPMLVAAGKFPHRVVRTRFLREAGPLDHAIRNFILDKMREFGRHVACHPLEQMLACLNFCADGVLEKFSKLKVAHLESGCGWAPRAPSNRDTNLKRSTFFRRRLGKPPGERGDVRFAIR